MVVKCTGGTSGKVGTTTCVILGQFHSPPIQFVSLFCGNQLLLDSCKTRQLCQKFDIEYNL